MSDFVAYEPGAHGELRGGVVEIRPATQDDAPGLAAVMSSRGGTPSDHLKAAQRLIDRLPVLLLAESAGDAVGWCGAQRSVIEAHGHPEWLVGGLTVIPESRRRGIASRLLQCVLKARADGSPGEPLFSVVNARNPASIDLHLALGFIEVARASTFAGIQFTGGEGVLLRHP
ncbi:GNAT family N-acetyltransferase [Demequina zhanjiangensis]|uniref:GNAT family N-acetyltransferase n=1 Tax=Demequina zhanjiangensis TaxID=3051659 RepID=A0ABT8G502_9MICO|nr:GNAT family N-acetyltransferase [Demequina sp. SYSU T00b26]MDN4474212.1 GNAT family N-acetyltransferase [Demequina sp. SYSU T00b26]